MTGDRALRERREFRGFDTRSIDVDIEGEQFSLLAPASPEALLEAHETLARFEEDEYLPYWAELWPAAVLLARRIRREQPEGDGRILEIGCGLGLCSLAAARAGWRPMASDYDEDAVAFATENARRHGVALATSVVDWRSTRLGERFDRIVGSDLLYERRNHFPIAEFLLAHLTARGEAWIGDSVRTIADPANAVFEAQGLVVDIEEEHGVTIEGNPKLIRILRCRRAGDRA